MFYDELDRFMGKEYFSGIICDLTYQKKQKKSGVQKDPSWPKVSVNLVGHSKVNIVNITPDRNLGARHLSMHSCPA